MLFQPKHVLPKPRKKETVNLRPGLNARNIEINYVRWVTGQHWSKAHLFNHRMIPDGGCRYCGLQLETREHIIFECTAPDIRDACLKFLKKGGQNCRNFTNQEKEYLKTDWICVPQHTLSQTTSTNGKSPLWIHSRHWILHVILNHDAKADNNTKNYLRSI